MTLSNSTNYYQRIHSKLYLLLSENSFQIGLMLSENSFQTELNTIRQLISDSNKSCQITYSKHFLSYQIIRTKT